MKIGNVEIKGRALLAPMAGVTDLPFRKICTEMGAALTYTEMVSAKGLLYSPERSGTLLAGGNILKPAALQLFGNEPELLADMVDQYAVDYDIIDINMGCPVPKVVKAGQGSALMRQPDWAAKIIETVALRAGKPVTAKIRKGWDGNHCNAVDFAKQLQDSGAAAIAVHGRTREQFYCGKADWEIIQQVKHHLSIPVIGSGDIFTAQNAQDMLEATGCDAVMVARGAQGNPWLFEQINTLLEGKPIRQPDMEERIIFALRHARELCELRGEKTSVQQMRKHLGWYIKGIPQAAKWRDKLNGLNTLADLERLLEEIGTVSI
jgi:tRNA-dihydrouridine synthase B